MEFQDVVRRRQMVRAFADSPLPPEVVDRLLRNAQRGPSSGFTQGFDFLVFRERETDAFWQSLGPRPDLAGVRSAPLVIVPLAHANAYVERYRAPDKQRVGRQSAEDFPAPYWFIDAAFAAMLILLTAVDADLGAFYFSIVPTSRQVPAFRETFGIPDTHHPIGAIAIGQPASTDPYGPPTEHLRDRRRDPASRLHFGHWLPPG